MTEIFDRTWTDPISRDPELAKRFEPTAGWYYFRERGAPKPSREQIVERYRAGLAKLPSSYYLMDLDGGPLGAAFDRRVKIVSEGP